MKFSKILLPLMIVAALGLAACNEGGVSGKAPAAGVAVVDPIEVFQTCAAGEKAAEYLTAQGKGMEAELVAMQEKMQKDGGQEAQAAFQARLQEMRQVMTAEQNRIGSILDEQFQKIMADYRAKNNVAVILKKENALSYSEKDDATKELIAMMNAANIDLQLPEAPAKAEEKAEEKKAE